MKVRYLQHGLYRLAGRHYRQKTYDHPEVHWRHEMLERFRELNQTYGIPVREAAALLGVPLSTLYRWRARYQARGLRGLRPRNRRPRHYSRKRWAPELARRLIQLRKEYPGWGKQKLTVLLRREGYAVSASTVGRATSDLLRAAGSRAVPGGSNAEGPPDRVHGHSAAGATWRCHRQGRADRHDDGEAALRAPLQAVHGG